MTSDGEPVTPSCPATSRRHASTEGRCWAGAAVRVGAGRRRGAGCDSAGPTSRVLGSVRTAPWLGDDAHLTHPRQRRSRLAGETPLPTLGRTSFDRGRLGGEHHNFAGGTVQPVEDPAGLRTWAEEVPCASHLDGARLSERSRRHRCAPGRVRRLRRRRGRVPVKGLGAPVGSWWWARPTSSPESRQWRKRLGGGMRQVGSARRCRAARVGPPPRATGGRPRPCSTRPRRPVSTRGRRHQHRRGHRRCGGCWPVCAPRASWPARSGHASYGWSHLDVSRGDAERAAAVLGRLVS